MHEHVHVDTKRFIQKVSKHTRSYWGNVRYSIAITGQITRWHLELKHLLSRGTETPPNFNIKQNKTTKKCVSSSHLFRKSSYKSNKSNIYQINAFKTTGTTPCFHCILSHMYDTINWIYHICSTKWCHKILHFQSYLSTHLAGWYINSWSYCIATDSQAMLVDLCPSTSKSRLTMLRNEKANWFHISVLE